MASTSFLMNQLSGRLLTIPYIKSYNHKALQNVKIYGLPHIVNGCKIKQNSLLVPRILFRYCPGFRCSRASFLQKKNKNVSTLESKPKTKSKLVKKT